MTWLLLFTMGVVTFFNRYFFLARSIAYQPGPKFKRFLSYSSFSVLTAIWAPLVLQFNHQSGLHIASLDYLVGATLAGLLSFLRVRSILVVLLSVSVFCLIRFF